MLGADQMMSLAHRALSRLNGEENEVTISAVSSALTRYANSEIHQNLAQHDCVVSMRTTVDGSSGWAQCNLTDDDSLDDGASYAERMARGGREGAARPLAGCHSYPDIRTFHCSTDRFDALARASAVKTMTEIADRRGFSLAGALQVRTAETAMVNDHGLRAYEVSTDADVLCVVSSADGSGYAARTARDVSTIDFAQVAEEAVHKCAINRGATPLPPGRYTVLLDEYAVGDMIMTLASMGFGADGVQSGASFLSGRFDEQVTDPRISIWDDALSPLGMPTRFDAEGVPKGRVPIITDGVAVGAVHDLTTAGRQGVVSTGHAGPGGPGSPAAANLFVQVGDQNKEEMIRSIDRGVYVTRLHYIARVNPSQTRWSGMTRDGTFLIEGGNIVRPVLNVRFDDRILDMLANVRSLSSEGIITRGYGSYATVPAMVIDGFNIVGSTQGDLDT